MERKSFILQRVAKLQDFFQQGIPVVARFLAQFLSDWDGQWLFLEVMQLLPYVQLTDYDELHEGVLAPLHKLFNATMTPMERLVFLHYLHKLVMHWACVEYFRARRHVCAALVGRLDVDSYHEKSKKKNSSSGEGVFGRADAGGMGANTSDSKTPLASLAALLQKWTSLAELGLVKTFVSDGEDSWKKGRQQCLSTSGDKAVYISEVLGMIRAVMGELGPLCDAHVLSFYADNSSSDRQGYSPLPRAAHELRLLLALRALGGRPQPLPRAPVHGQAGKHSFLSGRA